MTRATHDYANNKHQLSVYKGPQWAVLGGVETPPLHPHPTCPLWWALMTLSIVRVHLPHTGNPRTCSTLIKTCKDHDADEDTLSKCKRALSCFVLEVFLEMLIC